MCRDKFSGIKLGHRPKKFENHEPSIMSTINMFFKPATVLLVNKFPKINV